MTWTPRLRRTPSASIQLLSSAAVMTTTVELTNSSRSKTARVSMMETLPVGFGGGDVAEDVLAVGGGVIWGCEEGDAAVSDVSDFGEGPGCICR